MTPYVPWADWLAAAATQVGRASLDGALFALGVLVVTRLMTSLPATVRAALWWMVSARFLLGLVWVSPIPLPVLPAIPAEPHTVAVALTGATDAPALHPDVVRGATAARRSPDARRSRRWRPGASSPHPASRGWAWSGSSWPFAFRPSPAPPGC